MLPLIKRLNSVLPSSSIISYGTYRTLNMAATTERPIGALVPNAETPALYPPKTVHEGKHVIVKPLQVEHAKDIFPLMSGPDNAYLWDYMPDGPYDAEKDAKMFEDAIKSKSESKDPFFFAILDKKLDNKVVGYQSLMRIDQQNKVIEIGHINFTKLLQRTIGSTEAIYLLSKHIFEDLGYRRFEWKCNNLNAPSKRAAERYGFQFEGIFRQAIITKGRNRDTAWFSMLDSEWPSAKAAFEAWLDPSNFNADNQQIQTLAEIRTKQTKN